MASVKTILPMRYIQYSKERHISAVMFMIKTIYEDGVVDTVHYINKHRTNCNSFEVMPTVST